MNYIQHRTVAEVLEPWIEALSGDEWGEFMISLLQVYRDSDMLKGEEQDFLYKMLVSQFEHVDFEMIFDYSGVTLTRYKELVTGFHFAVESASKGQDFQTGKSYRDKIQEAVSPLPNWMKAVKVEDLPEWVVKPNYPTAAKLRYALETFADDDDVTPLIKALHKEL